MISFYKKIDEYNCFQFSFEYNFFQFYFISGKGSAHDQVNSSLKIFICGNNRLFASVVGWHCTCMSVCVLVCVELHLLFPVPI